MSNKVKWGILGAAKIARKKVVPGMKKGTRSEFVAIASRDLAKAKEAAKELGIPKAYGSYEELLADPDIQAVYNPLPNHLHVSWSVKAAEAGKHVLCEKPVALNAEEARKLVAARDKTGVKIMEAFMVRTYPQWLKAREIAKSGKIGDLRAIVGAFSYMNRDANNIRNKADIGGGALMDIGCYPVTTARFMFGEEPKRVVSLIDRDPEMKIDRLTTVLMEFPSGPATFSCSTQLVPYQKMHFFGTTGRIEIEIPFNAPPDKPCRIYVDNGKDLSGASRETVEFETLDQYMVQGERFSQAIQEQSDVATPLEDAVSNMAVIDAIFRSAESGKWETPVV